MRKTGDRNLPKIEPGSATKSAANKKRVSRACDECRLHKARCDGTKPCGTCDRYDRVCSYNLLPVECQGSAARIRILEHRLVKARECIDELQKQVPRNIAANFDHALAPQSVSHPAPPLSLLSNARSNNAAGMGGSFIESLLQPLAHHEQVKALISGGILRSILCDLGPGHNVSRRRFCHLPPYNTMVEVVYTSFTKIFGLSDIIPEQDFRIAAQRLYDLNPISYSDQDAEFVPLFCAIIALGMVQCSKIHHELDYKNVMKESLLYFEAAASSIPDNEECTSVPMLRLTLCIVLYSLQTSKLDIARAALEIVCASSMVRDLFRSISAEKTASLGLTDDEVKGMVWIMIYLDMNTSSLLGLAPLLHGPGPEMATIYAVNSAAHNVANYRRSDSSFLLSVSLAMAIELMKLSQRMIVGFVMPEDHKQVYTSEKSLAPSNSQTWIALNAELDTWEHLLQRIFPENEGNPAISAARNELQLHLYMTQILLHNGSLIHHAEDTHVDGQTNIDNIIKGRAGAAAATNIINHTTLRLEQTQSTTLCWFSAYILFIGTCTLLVAITSADAVVRGYIERSIHLAISTLRNANYGSNHSKSVYLEILQVLCTIADVNSDIPTPTDDPMSSSAVSTTSHSPWQNWATDHASSSQQGSSNNQWTSPPTRRSSEWGFDQA